MRVPVPFDSDVRAVRPVVARPTMAEGGRGLLTPRTGRPTALWSVLGTP